MSAPSRQFGFDWEPAGERIIPAKGRTYDAELDGERIQRKRNKVFELMKDQAWRTLPEIQKLIGGSENGIAARLRECRQERFGSHIVNSRRRGNKKSGLWEYQLLVKE
jgi:hypothetical protein